MPDEWSCEECLYKLVNKRTTRGTDKKINYCES